jgi:hypothetical protein
MCDSIEESSEKFDKKKESLNSSSGKAKKKDAMKNYLNSLGISQSE